MNHFAIAKWIDYVRGVASPTEARAMESHIAEGCEECWRLAGLLSRVQAEASSEPEVPAHLINAAKTVFARHAAAEISRWMSWPQIPVRLLSDASSVLSFQGARSVADPSVQLAYEAGDYAIDIQVEREPDSPMVAVVGVVANRIDARMPIGGVPVLLVARHKPVARSATNGAGEFCMTFRARQGLKLCLQFEAFQKRVEIPLTHTMPDLQ
jgi:hypothetical protein